MRHSIHLFSLIFIVNLFACNQVKEPTLKGVENVEILEANKEAISIKAELVFDNPNGFSIDLDRAEISAFLDDLEVAKFEQTLNAEMTANDDFNMPFNIDIDLKEIYSLDPMFAFTKGLKIMRDKKVLVRYKGTIYCGHGKVKIPIDIDREEWVAF